MARSRVNQRLVKQTERNLFFIVAGIVIVIILFLVVGVKLLVNFSLFVEKKSDSSADTSTNKEIMIAPILDPLTSATNSASIDITGTAGSGKYVVLYINGKNVKKADVNSDNTFAFHDATLDKGSNEIKIKAFTDNDKESKYSEAQTVVYSNKAPSLSVDFPSDGETYHKDNNPLRVRGKSDPNVKVTINDFWAMADDSGSYYYNLSLKNGDNEIKVVATDDAGNKTEKDLRVSYSE
ncbi:hypothetical protein BH09PAT1_BH09PAT1_8640 [soil metagenome]